MANFVCCMALIAIVVFRFLKAFFASVQYLKEAIKMSIDSGDNLKGLISMKTIKFNVGGKKFQTSYSTLAKYETMLKSLVCAEHNGSHSAVSIDEKGHILIDRDGSNFHYVLNFMRDGTVVLPPSVSAVKEILAEAEFYAFEELISKCNEQVEELEKGNIESFARCVYTKEELALIIASKEPLIIMSFTEMRLTGDHAAAFCSGVMYFQRMRLVFPRFRFVIDLSPKNGLSFTYEFVHNAKLITTVKVIESHGSGFTSYDFVAKFAQATNLLFASITASMDVSGAGYVSDMKALMN